MKQESTQLTHQRGSYSNLTTVCPGSSDPPEINI